MGRNGGGFGRRGLDSLAAPQGAASPAPARPRAGSPPIRTPRPSAKRFFAVLGMGLAAIILADACTSGTSLITPINSTFLNGMRILGALIGIPLGLFTVLSPQRPMGLPKKGLVLLFTPVLTGFAGGELAWRAADWYEFGLSSAPFVKAVYPIKYESASHRFYRRDTYEIDPYDAGESTRIPVPSAQFYKVFPNASDYCIAVMERRSPSGAIEIRTDGDVTLRQPEPVELTLCDEDKPAEQQPRHRSPFTS